MEIALPVRNTRTLMIATLAVFVLGLALSFSTWRNLRQQHHSLRQYALLNARSIATGIEISLARELPRNASQSRVVLPQRLAKGLLQEYIESTDARFIGLYNARGHILFSSHNDPKSIHVQLPSIAWESMGKAGEWSGDLLFEGQNILVLGRMSARINTRSCPEALCPPDEARPPLLLVGIDMSRQRAAFSKYKQTAILQTGYILVVTVLFWVLLMAVLNRSEQDQHLRRLKTFKARLLDHMPEGLLTLSQNGTIEAANVAAKNLLDQNPLLGRPFSDFFAGIEFNTTVANQNWAAFKTEDRVLEILQVPLRDNSGQRLVLLRDRTELAALEAELHRNEKLAAIGRVAAGVAHEIRNPLSSLRGFAQFFSKKLAGREPEELYAKTMVQEADRLNRVITDLLFLAKPRPLYPEEFSVETIFTEIHMLLSMDIGAAQCTLHLLHKDAAIFADRDALKQALLNLVMNSMAALPEHDGSITLEAQKDPKGTWITIHDNGNGMSAEEQEKALEPFFTTKDHGTGLGLTIVHTIMQEHGGFIELQSSSGQGTSLRLFFPNSKIYKN